MAFCYESLQMKTVSQRIVQVVFFLQGTMPHKSIDSRYTDHMNLLAKDILSSTFNKDLFLLGSVICLLSWRSRTSKHTLGFFVFPFASNQYPHSLSHRGNEGVIGRLTSNFPPNLMRTGTLCILFTNVYSALWRVGVTQNYWKNEWRNDAY